MAPIVLFAFYLSRRKKEISWKAVFACFIILALLSILIHAVVTRNILPALPGKSIWRDFIVGSYREGMVIHMRLHTYHKVPQTLLDYVFITIDRLIHYFYFSDALFSFTHIFVNAMIFVPTYILFILGIVSTIKEGDSSIKRSLIALGISVIMAYSLFHAMIPVDYDWRYRLPVYPYLLVVSGIGARFLLKSIRFNGRERNVNAKKHIIA